MATKDSLSLKVTIGLVIFKHNISQTLSKYPNAFLYRCEQSRILHSFNIKSLLMIFMVVKVVNNECKKVGEARKHTKYGNIKICNNYLC